MNGLEDNKIHDGHRSRMRAKLATHGHRIFDSYELLEMLLYYAIPYKDTNPVAKRLLFAFGSLEGVFSAKRDDLLGVCGIGERAAELILSVGRLSCIIGAEIVPEGVRDFSEYERVGDFLVNYFSGIKKNLTVALFLNNNMQLIDIKRICELDFESGAVRSKPFIDNAIKTRAAVVITAHNHPYGPMCATEGDRQTNRAISTALSKLGITCAEHYIVCADSYMGINSVNTINRKLCQTPEFYKFVDGKTRYGEEILNMSCEFDSELYSRPYNVRHFRYFVELLRNVSPKCCEMLAHNLLLRYQTIENVFTADITELEECCAKNAAVFLKLLAYITSRRKTDEFAFGVGHTKGELADYFRALFIGESVENVYIMVFNSACKPICCEIVGSGTVNVSEVIPRKAVEVAVRNNAKYVAIAHNHPFGRAYPSSADSRFTESMASIFMECGVVLLGHYIVAGQECNAVFSTEK